MADAYRIGVRRRNAKAKGRIGRSKIERSIFLRERTGVPKDDEAFRNAGAFAEKNGPLYFRPSDSTLGFRVSPAHTNPIGVCHGGWLSTLLDMQMSLKAFREGGFEDRFLVTVSLSLDFLAIGSIGTWIEGQATVLGTK